MKEKMDKPLEIIDFEHPIARTIIFSITFFIPYLMLANLDSGKEHLYFVIWMIIMLPLNFYKAGNTKIKQMELTNEGFNVNYGDEIIFYRWKQIEKITIEPFILYDFITLKVFTDEAKSHIKIIKLPRISRIVINGAPSNGNAAVKLLKSLNIKNYRTQGIKNVQQQ